MVGAMILSVKLSIRICVVVVCFSYFFVGASSGKDSLQRHLSEVEPLLKKIEREHSPRVRWELADDLSDILRQAPDAGLISDGLVVEISRLLRDETTDFWAALALGQLGPRAAAAVPELEEALKKAEEKEKPQIIFFGPLMSDTLCKVLTKITGRVYESKIDLWLKSH